MACKDIETMGFNAKRQCTKKTHHTYTATFDDLHVPYIPKPYNGLEFSEHFTFLEPSLIYSNYTAPSPLAAISYASNKSRMLSMIPFNPKSMYVGCEVAQACLNETRGWSPNGVQPAAELHVRVNNWSFVRLSNFGFNQITMLGFDVLDLTSGTRGTLELTLDEITLSKEVFEFHECFD
ncbi:hypothetical protein BDZ91DRAFT_54893 [Kalaharituber pfeilii]|nr:hypothetical protein BDZ91DRAFT_54893 [Kalaharituber pfeilii]